MFHQLKLYRIVFALISKIRSWCFLPSTSFEICIILGTKIKAGGALGLNGL